MNIIIKQKRGNVVQVTTLDERWYGVFDKNERYTGYRPSLTWICSYYPKGKYYEKWMAGHGYDESQILMREAGERGSRVHRAIEELLKKYIKHNQKDRKIKMTDVFTDLEGGKKDLDPDEWYAVMTFVDWFKQKNIKKVLGSEQTLITKEFGCTLDVRYIFEDKGKEVYEVTDFKTSQTIHPNSEIQLTGQKTACEENNLRVDKTSILQVGYKLNKRGWKETVYAHRLELLKATHVIWKNENSRKQPHQRDYPLELSLF